MRSRSAVLMLGAAVACAAVAHYLVFTSDHAEAPVPLSLLGPLLGLAFVVTGVVARARRPENRTGTLMILVGFAWFLDALVQANNDLLFTIGLAFGALAYGPYAHLVYAFPTGRLESRLTRVATGLVYFDVLALQIALMLVDPTPGATEVCADCPDNVLAVADRDSLALGLATTQRLLGLGLLGLALYLLFRRWRESTPASRRAITPVLAAITPSLVLLGTLLIVAQASESAAQPVYWALLVAWLAVPGAFLVGVLRSRLARAGVARLLVEVPSEPTPAEAQEAIRRVLNDPTLQLLYWVADARRYVDVDGKPFDLPPDTATCVTTKIEYEDHPVGAIVHDAALLDEPELLEEVVATCRIGMEKDRGVRELRASEARNRALVDAIPDNMYRVRRDGTIVDFVHKRPTVDVDFRGRTIFDAMPGEPAERLIRCIDETIAGGGVKTALYSVETEIGLRHFETRVVKSSDDDEALLIERDITTRVEHERALRASEERNAALLDAIPDVMFRYARDGTFVDVNAKESSWLTTTPDELIGKNVRDVLPPDLAALALDTIERALDAGLQSVEYPLEVRGELRQFEGRLTPSGDDEVVMIVRDVTERKRQEEALRASEARNSALLNAIPDLMFRISADGTYLDFNAHDDHDLYTPADEIIGKTISERLPADVAEQLTRCMREALESGGVRTIEYELEFGGARRHYEGRIVPSGADEVVLIVREITERKRQEAEIQASRARLVQAGDEERRRLERNLHDGAQQRLVSLSLALRLAQAKLRTDPDTADEILANAASELQQALEELRELARGIHPAVLTERGLEAAVESLATRSPVPVTVDMPPERLPQPVEAAAYYVVSEALANVAKYADASQVDVRVARDDGRVVVEVSDDGVGGADLAAGTGLRGLVDRVAALQGTFDINSVPGAGTRIRAEIPLDDAPEE